MVKNQRWLLLAAALICSSLSGLAKFGGDADVCFDYDEPFSCFDDPSGLCFWSYGEDFCAVRINAPGFCDGMPNYDSCIISAGCVWEEENNWCVEGYDNYEL